MFVLHDSIPHELHREREKKREHGNDDHVPQQNVAGHHRPIAQRRSAGAQWLPMREYEGEAHDALESRFECREGRRSPRPFSERESAEMDRRHHQNERSAEEEQDADAERARVSGVGQNQRAVESHHDAGNQSHLDDGPGKLAERGRLPESESG
jgi:hypothetical protein